MGRLFAHKNQPLIDHLAEVAETAGGFARTFDASEHARIAGMLHDLGKAEPHFQKRLAANDKGGKLQKEPHAHHGAALALEQQAWPIAIAVNGHHAGLHDRSAVDRICIEYLRKAEACIDRLIRCHPHWVPPHLSSALPAWLAGLAFDARQTAEGWFAIDVFTRFLFSALVDADSLDAEEHEQGESSIAARKWPKLKPEQRLQTLKTELDDRLALAKKDGTASDSVQSVWTDVRDACLSAATQSPGLFSMTVPTGGGKTLASLLFALAHAAHHNAATGTQRFRRIVVVIPYLSIIHQTAKELRDVLGDDLILEHHSQADEPDVKSLKKEKHDGPVDETARRRRLAAENWDAPIIVTTSAQFFSSLFSRRRSAARKLHNLCKSIVIFDEVQTLPPLLMQPILNVLGELTNPDRPYGCSMVFCTATQPALQQSEDLPCGLKRIRPIVLETKVREHFSKLARVEYEWPEEGETLTWDQLAERIVGDPSRADQQALAIVNTRQQARDLHAAIEKRLRLSDGGQDAAIDGLFHLSTWMIPSHRDQVLQEVKDRVKPDHDGKANRRCILVSTQCIEAGVDVDFPEVWRAFGPYDSIIQAGGRCNRRGLRSTGTVRVFYPAESTLPPGLYHTATSQTELLRRVGLADPHNPDSFGDYFRLLYQLSVPDDCIIQKERAKLHFQQVHELFKFIDDNTYPVLVLNQRFTPDGDDVETEAKQIYAAAEARGFLIRDDWRAFQPYIINLARRRNHDPFKEFVSPVFDQECGLRIWNGKYLGGTGGVGITPLRPEDYVL